MHLVAVPVLLAGAAGLGLVHSVLPDHWVPISIAARTQRWSYPRLAWITLLAAGGHVVASVALGGVVALVGLQFQRQIETQQGHVVGAVLVVTGLGFLLWALSGRAHPHERDHHAGGEADCPGAHVHVHSHGEVHHSHRHRHDEFVHHRASLIESGKLSAIVVPFGVAASPDLTFLPLALAASAYGRGAVAGVLGAFVLITVVAFLGLTLGATAVGYQMRGEWLEDHANTITSVVLIGIGVIAFVGF